MKDKDLIEKSSELVRDSRKSLAKVRSIHDDMDGTIDRLREGLQKMADNAQVEIDKYEPRDFIDPAKMAEQKGITDARVEGWQKGQKHGFNRGLAWGIGGMVLFYSTVHALMKIIS